MPVLKGTPDNFDTWYFAGDVYSLSRYDFLRMSKAELAAWRVREVCGFCDKLARQLLQEHLYFIGFYDFNFFELEDSENTHSTLRGNLTAICRKFKEKLSVDEIDYWGKSFSNRMAVEITGFLGLDDYFIVKQPEKLRNER